nr:hypothetical protein [Tanacetum cinerariifolium]
MATTLDQKVVLDEALVPSSQRAFLVTADVPEIYMQEFWATTKLHQHSIRFKTDTRKHVLDLEAFREMLHISPRIPGNLLMNCHLKRRFWSFLVSEYLKRKSYRDCITEATLTMPILSGKILCIKWNTKIKRRAKV